MRKIYTDLTLDFADNRSLQCVRVMQGDKTAGRIIRISLTNNGEAVPLDTNIDTATLWASVGGCITVEDTECLISDNQVHIFVMGELTDISGTEHCTVKIESANGIVHTARFDLLVAPNPVSDDMPERVSTASLVQRVTQAENDIDTLEGQLITLIGRATQLETTTSELTANLANYVKWTLTGMFRGWVRTDRTVTGSSDNTLLEDSPYYLIEKTYFDPDKRDGVMIWKNTTELVPPAWYSFDTETYESEGKVKIDFHTNDDESYFTASDRFYFAFYKNPAPLAMWTGTQAQYDALASYDTNTLYIIEEASS